MRVSPSTASRFIRVKPTVALLSVCVAVVSYSLGSSLVGPATGNVVGSKTNVSKGHGLDICESTTPKAMEDWWKSTLYYFAGTYIGGVTGVEECATPNREWYVKTHVAYHEPQVREIGWDFLPIFDGKQAPCTGNIHHFSANTSQAAEEGAAEANSAVAQAEKRGFVSPGTIIYLDLEAYAYTEEACDKAVLAYVNGWVRALHETYGVKAGVYGSVAAADWKGYAALKNPPDDVWLAEYGTGQSVFDVESQYIPDSDWPNRRFHQYAEGVTETHGGHEMTIDLDCANGVVAGWEEGDSPACYAK